MKIYYLPVCLLDKYSLFQVNKNATLCKSLDELFQKGANEVNQSALKELMQKVSHTRHACHESMTLTVDDLFSSIIVQIFSGKNGESRLYVPFG